MIDCTRELLEQLPSSYFVRSCTDLIVRNEIITNKKTFQLQANRPLPQMNKFEHVCGGGGGGSRAVGGWITNSNFEDILPTGA